jgi:cytoskeletal protein CcmA (bactofilin family)
MALQPRFFGNPKRDLDQALNATTSSNSVRNLSTTPGTSSTSSDSSFKPLTSSSESERSVNTSSSSSVSSSSGDSPSRLTVGPHIKLKGVEITDCDTLVVEGSVEATMDSRVMQIAEGGSFTGSAEIDIAEIRGDFNGNLTVRQKLTLHASAKVKGKIRYGRLIMEEGAQLSGEIEFGATAANASASTAAKPVSTTAAAPVQQSLHSTGLGLKAA